MADLEFVRPRRPRGVVGLEGERHGDRAVARSLAGFQGPLPGARQAVIRRFRVTGAGAEPWKDHGHAASDGLAGGELASLAEEQQRPLARRTIVRDVCTVEVNMSLGRASSDGSTNQPAGSRFELEHARDGEPLVERVEQFRGRHFCLDGTRTSKAAGGFPRLLVGGKVQQLKPQIAERTAVCAEGNVVVLVVSTKAEATAFARFLADPPDKGGLGCWDALNLDGGPSTQLVVELPALALSLPGGWVPNALVVAPGKR